MTVPQRIIFCLDKFNVKWKRIEVNPSQVCFFVVLFSNFPKSEKKQKKKTVELYNKKNAFWVYGCNSHHISRSISFGLDFFSLLLPLWLLDHLAEIN